MLLEPAADLFERIDIELLANLSKFLRFNVANDINQHSLFIAFQDGDDQPLHSFVAADLEIDPDILILLLRGHDTFPSLSIELASDCFHSLLDFSAILFIEPDHINPNELEAAEQFRDFRFLFLSESRDHRDQVALDVYFNEFAA